MIEFAAEEKRRASLFTLIAQHQLKSKDIVDLLGVSRSVVKRWRDANYAPISACDLALLEARLKERAALTERIS